MIKNKKHLLDISHYPKFLICNKNYTKEEEGLTKMRLMKVEHSKYYWYAQRIWLKKGVYFGYDYHGTPCYTELQRSEDGHYLLFKMSTECGTWVERYIHINSPALPVDLQQHLFAIDQMRKTA